MTELVTPQVAGRRGHSTPLRGSDTLTDRKARGAFFTPPGLAAFLAGWALRAPDDRVLDPAAGEAVFVTAAAGVLRQRWAREPGPDQLVGLEVHGESAAHAAAELERAGVPARLRVGDFFEHDARPEFDVVIGNPPYIRYQHFAGAARARARGLALAQGTRLSGLASSWAPFVIHAGGQLRPDGRLGLVVPGELLNRNYAAAVRGFLLTRFAHVRLVVFEERVFPGVLEEVVLVLAEGSGGCADVEVVAVRDADDLADLADLRAPASRAVAPKGTAGAPSVPAARTAATRVTHVLPSDPADTEPEAPPDQLGRPGQQGQSGPVDGMPAVPSPAGPATLVASPGVPVSRRFRPPGAGTWIGSLVDPAALELYERVRDGSAFVELGRWGAPRLGIVTGNNSYFTLSPADVERHRLADDEVLPISPPGSRHLRRLSFTGRDWQRLADDGRRVYLFRPPGEGRALSPGARRFVAAGEDAGVATAYKCRVRDPWWQVPEMSPPDLFVTYMNHEAVQLSANLAGVRCLNSVHGLRLDRPDPGRGVVSVAVARGLLPIAALSTVSLLSGELVGRSFGGGMLQVLPREAARLAVPSPEALGRVVDALRDVRPAVRRLLGGGRLTAAADLVDDVLLVGPGLLRRAEVAILRQAHAALAARRMARSSSGGPP